MKLTRIGQGLLATAACLGVGLSLTACSPSDTIDYLFVTSNNPKSEVTSYHVDSIAGTITQVTGTPVSSQGTNPVAEVASPNQQYLYVANHDSNNIGVFQIGTDGQLAPWGSPVTTPGSEPIALGINNAGTLLFVVDYYGPGYSDASPGPGALIVYPIASNGSLGSPVVNGSNAFTPLQCFPGGVAVTANGNYVYVTNTNTAINTTAAPSSATLPATPSTCPSQGTISGFAIGSSGSLTAIPGSPFLAGSTPTGIAADPTNRFVYATDSVQNQLIVYDILSSGTLNPVNNGPFATGGVFPVSVVVDPRGLYIYVGNYSDGTISEFTIIQSTGAPSSISNSTGSFNTKATGTTCVVVDPAIARFVFASDYIGSDIAAAELVPNTGALSANQGQPYQSPGGPTCVAAVPHGNHAGQYTSALPSN